MEEINFNELRKTLIDIYKRFLENPESEKTINEIIELDKKLGGLSYYNEVFKDRFVPEDIARALSGLSTLYQYGLHPDDHRFSKDNIIKEAEEILRLLENEIRFEG